jgi:hypothetical protein
MRRRSEPVLSEVEGTVALFPHLNLLGGIPRSLLRLVFLYFRAIKVIPIRFQDELKARRIFLR